MKQGQLSLYIVTPDSQSPILLQKIILGFVKCKLETPHFRFNDSPSALFWWDLEIKNITTFRNQIKKFQHEHPYMSVFIMDHSLSRTYSKCC